MTGNQSTILGSFGFLSSLYRGKVNMPSKTKFNPNYFRFPNPFIGIPVLLLTFLLLLTMFWPDSMLVYLYGPAGQLGRYMSKHQPELVVVIYRAALVTHLAEAVFAYYLSRKKGLHTGAAIKWTVQTFIVGFPSLLRLVPSRSNTDKKTA